MLGWIRGASLGAILLVGFAACGGDDFSSEGTGAGGSDASTGGATGGAAGSASGGSSSGGTAGVVGIDAPANNCVDGLQGQTCQNLSTGVDACDQCGRDFCCAQVDACLANAACAQAMRCYLDHCFGQPATACMVANCQPCVIAAAGPFTTMSGCLLDNCGGPGEPCPEFQQ
jgi:hypothetical protein